MLTPKRSVLASRDADELIRLTQAITVGGSAEREVTEVAVKPARSRPTCTVTMLTPPASSRIADLKADGSAGMPSACAAPGMDAACRVFMLPSARRREPPPRR